MKLLQLSIFNSQFSLIYQSSFFIVATWQMLNVKSLANAKCKMLNALEGACS